LKEREGAPAAVEKDIVLEIVDLCLAIDMVAFEAFGELASRFESEELRSFWRRMSDEEKTHVDFWQRIREAGKRYSLPQVFESPSETRAELEKIAPRAEALLERFREVRDVSSAFVLAYRLEFYMLHPAFEMLFHLFRMAAEGATPEDHYEEHIDHFIEMLSKRVDVSPEVELLGETIRRLWKQNKRLAYQAARDGLTGLLSRQAFFAISTQLCHLAQREQWNVGVMMLDADDFKAINDEYGHERGDTVLKALSQTLESSIRASDLVGRYGGEEFIVLLPRTRADTILSIAEKIRKRIETLEPTGLHVTASIGVGHGVLESDVSEGLMTLIRQADANLYTAKRRGKNCVCAGVGS
jgi:diguanylate cyclase (GGDEF)-like protein